MNAKTLPAKVAAELLYQALETEKGGVQIYVTALRCALFPRQNGANGCFSPYWSAPISAYSVSLPTIHCSTMAI